MLWNGTVHEICDLCVHEWMDVVLPLRRACAHGSPTAASLLKRGPDGEDVSTADPPLLGELADSDTPELIDIYARAWLRRAMSERDDARRSEMYGHANVLAAEAERRRCGDYLRPIGDLAMAQLSASIVYVEAGEDEPTREVVKPTMCYVCAAPFTRATPVRLPSGVHVCTLCATLF